MKSIRYIFALSLVSLLAAGCDFVSGLLHDDDVVARYGRRKLYASQVARYIPKNVSPEDSANLAARYINSWAMDLLYQNVAETRLSKADLDMSKEMEDYRRSLLKFRYEQQYLGERLDTVVSISEIEEYYTSHKSSFVLEVPIVKARFLDIMPESPNLELLKKKMSSSDYEDLAAADSISYSSAIRYEDHSDEWMDAVAYARNFGVDYGTLLSTLKPDGFVEIRDDRGDARIGFITDIVRKGQVAPLEYCHERIRDIIISSRKRELLSTLERDLLDDALEHQELIIY